MRYKYMGYGKARPAKCCLGPYPEILVSERLLAQVDPHANPLNVISGVRKTRNDGVQRHGAEQPIDEGQRASSDGTADKLLEELLQSLRHSRCGLPCTFTMCKLLIESK